MNKPLREHFITPTDLGEALQTFRYIDELEKYINHLEQNQAQLQQHGVMQAEGSDVSEGAAVGNSAAGKGVSDGKCPHPRENRAYIGDGYLRCNVCGEEFT